MNNRTPSPEAQLFQVTIETQDGQLAIRLSGEMDAAAADQLRVAVANIDNVFDRPALVDLSSLTFCDPAGVRELLALKQLLNTRHPSVKFEGVSPRIQRIMDIAETHHVFGPAETDPP